MSETMVEVKTLRPLQAIRAYCRDDCCVGQGHEVRKCVSADCALYDLRFGRKPKDRKPSSLRQIRLLCLDCSAGSPPDVRKCWDTDCALYRYRMGKNPGLKGRGKGRGNPESLRKWREAQARDKQSL